MTATTGDGPATGARSTQDPVLGRITDGVGMRVRGRRGEARRLLLEVWDEIGPGGNPLHRCSAAHALAGVQDDASVELEWHLRALLAADQVSEMGEATARPAELYPSLHLALADVHHRLGRDERARLHLDLGRAALSLLTDDVAARITLGDALDRLEDKFEDTLEDRLASPVDEPARR